MAETDIGVIVARVETLGNTHVTDGRVNLEDMTCFLATSIQRKDRAPEFVYDES